MSVPVTSLQLDAEEAALLSGLVDHAFRRGFRMGDPQKRVVRALKIRLSALRAELAAAAQATHPHAFIPTPYNAAPAAKDRHS